MAQSHDCSLSISDFKPPNSFNCASVWNWGSQNPLLAPVNYLKWFIEVRMYWWLILLDIKKTTDKLHRVKYVLLHVSSCSIFWVGSFKYFMENSLYKLDSWIIENNVVIDWTRKCDQTPVEWMEKHSKVSDNILGSSSVHSFLLNMKQNLLGNE